MYYKNIIWNGPTSRYHQIAAIFEETKLLNFYNIGGIRFQNIAANDAVINSKVNDMLNQGWEIVQIASGVEAVGGKDDSNGLYLTRFYFKKAK